MVCGDWSNQKNYEDYSGLFGCGQYATVEEAIKAASLPQNIPKTRYVGAWVETIDGYPVAESNSEWWGDQVKAWHTNLQHKKYCLK